MHSHERLLVIYNLTTKFLPPPLRDSNPDPLALRSATPPLGHPSPLPMHCDTVGYTDCPVRLRTLLISCRCCKICDFLSAPCTSTLTYLLTWSTTIYNTIFIYWIRCQKSCVVFLPLHRRLFSVKGGVWVWLTVGYSKIKHGVQLWLYFNVVRKSVLWQDTNDAILLFFLQKSPLLGYKCISIQNSTWILLCSAAA